MAWLDGFTGCLVCWPMTGRAAGSGNLPRAKSVWGRLISNVLSTCTMRYFLGRARHRNEATHLSGGNNNRMKLMNAKYPGIPNVIHGNGAVAQVMSHVCGGVIGYPITPSTEISEIYEAFRAGGGMQRLGQAPVLLRARGRAFRAKRRARRGADRRQVHFQRLVQPGHPVRPRVALRDGRQEGRRLRAAGRGPRRFQAFAQRHGRP